MKFQKVGMQMFWVSNEMCCFWYLTGFEWFWKALCLLAPGDTLDVAFAELKKLIGIAIQENDREDCMALDYKVLIFKDDSPTKDIAELQSRWN